MSANRLPETSTLRQEELEAVYSISSIVSEALSVDEALDEITQITREVLIFDSAVIYRTHEEEELLPVFARLIGRGRSSPGNINWGEDAAREVLLRGETYFHNSEIEIEGDRLDQQFYLGIPMIIGGKINGGLVFVRFGGPEYSNDQINLAEFIATHISQLFEHQRLVEKIANLEAERRLTRLQDDFIAMVSHELNTPLGFIKGYATTLLRKDAEWSNEDRIEFLTIIDEETDRLGELIENLLDSSRLQSGTLRMERKPIQIESLAHNIQDHIHTRFGVNLDFELDIDPTPELLLVDPKRFTQVMDNLISNAVKYAPNSPLEIKFKSGKDFVTITIADQGPGIPEENIEHLFNRFYRVPKQSAGVRGTGLGLFICARIIQAHQGTITVDSVLKKGTTFTIQLPTKEFLDKQQQGEESHE